MTINENLFTPKFIAILYHTLRQVKGWRYKAEDYKWRLGVAILNEYERDIIPHNKDVVPTLYGIEIEIDYHNPYNLQLFEDITDKVALEKGEQNDNDTQTI